MGTIGFLDAYMLLVATDTAPALARARVLGRCIIGTLQRNLKRPRSDNANTRPID